MTVAVLDTLTVVRDLEAAGVERRQAEAHAEALRQAIAADRDSLATKADLAKIDGTLSALKAELGAMRWLLGFLMVLTAAMAARLFGAI